MHNKSYAKIYFPIIIIIIVFDSMIFQLCIFETLLNNVKIVLEEDKYKPIYSIFNKFLLYK
jgi:hypothetical protein